MQLLEYTSLLWSVLGGYLLAVLGLYVFTTVRKIGWRHQRLLLAKALAVTFLGMTGRMFTTWIAMRTDTWQDAMLPLAIFTVIATGGILCLCRVLAPDRWGHWGWALPLILALGTVPFAVMD